MTTAILTISGGALVAALGWTTAYWMGRIRGYEEGRAEEREIAWEDAARFCDTLVQAQEAL